MGLQLVIGNFGNESIDPIKTDPGGHESANSPGQTIQGSNEHAK